MKAHTTEVRIAFLAEGYHEATKYAATLLGDQNPMGELTHPVDLFKTGEMFRCEGYTFSMRGNNPVGEGVLNFRRVEPAAIEAPLDEARFPWGKR